MGIIVAKLRTSVNIELAEMDSAGSCDYQGCRSVGLVPGLVPYGVESKTTLGRAEVTESLGHLPGGCQRHLARHLSSLHRWHARFVCRRWGRDRWAVGHSSALKI